ncbi:MAG: TIR domain-containing protein [Marinicaulis sp.]|nr:TIR domain-containing protein [Marinicaulis sp.]
MTDIFISYAHSDRPKIEKLADQLIGFGYDVWWDHELIGGTTFASEIERALHQSKCVIVAWSIKSIQSEWVLDEASEAKRRGKLIPIRFDATVPPLGFRQFQTLDFSDWDGVADSDPVSELKKGVSRFLKPHPGPHDRETSTKTTVSLAGGYSDTIAVLPLENLTGSADQQFLVDGLHEAVIIQLSKIKALRVISRTSVRRFAGSPLSLPEIAAELGVEKIVEGSIMRAGEKVLISVQLIDVRSDTTLWAERFERNAESILDLQNDAAAEIAQQTSVILTPEDRNRLGTVKNVKPEAYEKYLKGMFHWYKLSPEDTQLAIENFEQALSKEPDFAPAHAGLAAVWAGIQQMGIMQPSVVSPKIKYAAERALALDPNSFQAHFMWAVYSTWSAWDWEGAEQAYLRAIDLNPNFPDTHAYYSHFLNIVGRFDEARLAIGKALNLDPFNPLIRSLYAVDLAMWQEFEKALEELIEIRKAAAGSWLPLQIMRFIYHSKGQHDDAYEITKELYSVLDKPSVVEALISGMERDGYRGALIAAGLELETLSATSYLAPIQIAVLFHWGGDIEKAAEWVRIAYEQRDPEAPYIKNMIFFSDDAKAHPKIKGVIDGLNYP